MGKSGIAVGLNKGFIVTQVARRQKASHRKGKLGKRVDAIRHIIREVAGFAPYEKRCIELIKTN
jgi:large subunit ribosomal protein L36e